ncbi:hypothetical protein ABK040_016708 [Willaertia magna]
MGTNNPSDNNADLSKPLRSTSPTHSNARRFSSTSSVGSKLSTSSTPHYMLNTLTFSTKLTPTAKDARTSTPEPRMKFGLVEYHNKPASVPKPYVGPKKARVTPRKERIYTTVTPLKFGDICVLIGLGTISIPNYKLTSLEGLGVRRDLKVFYLQNNYLTSFKHLESQPCLEVLYAANNCISSLLGLEYQPKLQLINLEGNPITKHPHYRLMCLIAAGVHLKKIDGEAVQFKEREFVKQYLAANEKCVEAIRLGWLMDMKPRTTEEFDEIIEELKKNNYDDRESIRASQAFKDLVSGALMKTTPSIDLDLFDPRSSQCNSREKTSENNKESSVVHNYQTAYLNQYAVEIKNLKQQIEKKNEELKKEKQRLKEVKETYLNMDELSIMNSIVIENFSVSLNATDDNIRNVTIIITQEHIQLVLNNEPLKMIDYCKVIRTSLLMDEQKMFRLHMRLNNNDIFDIISSYKKQALSLYKIIHLMIARYNKVKKETKNLEKLETDVNINEAENATSDMFKSSTNESTETLLQPITSSPIQTGTPNENLNSSLEGQDQHSREKSFDLNIDTSIELSVNSTIDSEKLNDSADQE